MITFNFNNLRILSFSAHPDDDIGGAGGFLLQAKKNNALIKLALCLDPAEERINATAKQERVTRIAEFEMAATQLGAEFSYLGLPRYPLLNLENLLPLIKEIRDFRPRVILAPSEEEYHRDHRTVYELVKTAAWQAGRNAFPGCGLPWKTRSLLQYEADNPMRNPTIIRDISDVMEEKKKLLSSYSSQIRRKDLVSAVEGLNRFRGIMYKKGVYAEAFKISEFFYG